LSYTALKIILAEGGVIQQIINPEQKEMKEEGEIP
jgi:hypothetical protein